MFQASIDRNVPLLRTKINRIFSGLRNTSGIIRLIIIDGAGGEAMVLQVNRKLIQAEQFGYRDCIAYVISADAGWI
jgi:hypothetical protein